MTRLSTLVLFALALLVGFALPVGVQRSHASVIGLRDCDLGGRRVDVDGEVAYESRGYGMPSGFLRHGAYAWGPLERPAAPAPVAGTFGPTGMFSAQWTLSVAAGWKPLPATPELREAVLKRNRAAGHDPEAEPAGLFLAWEALPASAIFTLVYFLITWLWWVAARRFTWDVARTPAGNALGLARLAIAPWLVGSWTIWVEWRTFRGLVGVVPTAAPEALVVLGTMAAASLLLVLVVCRKEWQRGLAALHEAGSG